MNLQNLRKVRDRISRLDGAFSDMSIWAHGKMIGEGTPECGTTACIAGHTIAVEHGHYREDETYDPYDEARRILDLTANQASALFYSSRWKPEYKALIGALGDKAGMVKMLDDVISGQLVLR